MTQKECVRLAIGGIALSLLGGGEDPPLMPSSYNAFSHEGQPDVTLVASNGGRPKSNALGECRFDARPNWRLFRKKERWTIRTRRCDAVSSPDFRSVMLYPKKTRGVPPDTPLFDYPLAELLMINVLGLHGGILLHACAILEKDEVHLFCGMSGHGKSTMTGVWNREGACTVLSDDRIIVRREGKTFRAHGTPWHGEGHFSSPRSGGIARLFFLRHGKENRARRIGEADALALLLARAFPPFWDRTMMDRTMDVAAGIVTAVPCYELAFVPDHGVVDYVRSL